MAKEWAKPFYNSARWKAARNRYICERRSIDGGMCEICGINIGYIVHHCEELTPDNINSVEVTLSPDNFLYVCKDCHDKFEGHFYNFRAKKHGKCIEFDDDGQPIPPYSHL